MKITMVRVPVYARKETTAYKETTQIAYAEDLNKDRTTVMWKGVMGSMIKNRHGEWSVINTNRSKYEIQSIKKA